MTGVDHQRHQAVEHVTALSAGPPLDPALRVSVHFHPDRHPPGDLRRPAGRVIERLLIDGVYLSQFATGISNGGLTARPGGDRWRWEQRMFAGAYDDAPAEQRPVYGALNHRRRRSGGSIRFGSAHLRLRAEVSTRCTFCYPDSSEEPAAVGTAERMSLIIIAEADDRDRLDDYVEAQVHGGLRLDTDVEALVLDPSYAGTEVAAIASELPCPVEWHQGFRLAVDRLEDEVDYRGPETVVAGRAIAERGWLDARILGVAADQGRLDPQLIKQVWHYVARFGEPFDASS